MKQSYYNKKLKKSATISPPVGGLVSSVCYNEPLESKMKNKYLESVRKKL